MAYTMVVEGQPGSVTWCLREGSEELAQLIIADGATTTVTMTISYDDIEVTAP